MKNLKIATALVVMMITVNCFGASNIGIAYNNEALHLSSDVRVVNNSVLLPLRDVTESLGYKVNWDEKVWGKITITKGKTSVVLELGSKMAEINGESKTLEVAPVMYMVGKNTVTYVPIRFISEAFGVDVKWSSKDQMVYLTGEAVKLQQTSGEKAAALKKAEAVGYLIDKKNGKLLENGKAVADLKAFDKEATVTVESITTKNGNHIVTVTEQISGALTSSGYHNYYVRNSKVVKKIDIEPSLTNNSGVFYDNKNQVVFCDGKTITIYDDATGSVKNTYNTAKMSRVEKNKEASVYFDMQQVGSNYAIGRINGKTYVADFTNNKMTCMLDAITNAEDNFYVYQDDLMVVVDDIHFKKQNGSQLIFEYPSITEGTNKEIIYTVGQ